jgi:hopene-associated glycosyltransferase HpnB
VVPARDEAGVLPTTVPTLVAQRYPGPLRLILVDDGSTDGTAALVAGRWPEVTVVTPGPTPAGWAGKLWALRAGVAEAGEAEFLLLTDADITHPPDSVLSMVRAAAAHRLDLVSQMARLRAVTGWERLIVPAFVYFFALLFPFRWSNRPGSRTAAAAGGCVLVRRSTVERAGGLAAIRGAVIDDVALARAVKRTGARTFLGLADRVASVRPYPDLASLWHMVARSAYAQLRHSVPLLAGTVLGLVLVFLVPPVSTVVGAVAGDVPTLLAGSAAWLLMAATFVPMLRYYGQPAVAAALLPFTATLYLAMTVDSAIRGASWKGRGYPA